jgi:hypothetical protein
MNNNIISIIEDGYNTSYITTLFIALFYNENENMNKIINDIPVEINGLYLQELIKQKFIELIKRNLCIYSDTLNEIRNYLFVIGWCNDDIDRLLDSHDLIDFFIFLLKKFRFESIDIETINIVNGKIDEIKNDKFNYIRIIPSKNNTTIKFLLDNWISYNINTNNNLYKLTNIPPYIIINIDRFDKYNIKNASEIDIMKKIKLNNINDSSQLSLRWKLSSIICYIGDTLNSGKYYCIIHNNNKWIKYEEGGVPSFTEIDISLNSNSKKIKSEVIFLIYHLCE